MFIFKNPIEISSKNERVVRFGIQIAFSIEKSHCFPHNFAIETEK